VAFVLVGGKPDQIEYWKEEVRKNNLEDCVIFTGAVTPAETLAYLEMAEILVSPRTEGLSVPLKIYTYLYSGKPTVATELIAHTQILNNENAVLVTPEREAFAEGILGLIRDPDLRRRVGLKAQEFVKGKSTLANYLTKLKQIYQPFQPIPALEQPAPFSTELQAPLS
jgi:glycosyltransferase involved in cell wall biosynthesis